MMRGALERMRGGLMVAALVAGAWAGVWTVGVEKVEAKASLTKPATKEPAATAMAAGTLPMSKEARSEITKLPAPSNDPKTIDDLKTIQARVEAVVKATLPATVSIQFPYAQGSGVIVSKDGYILTAGHVSGTPGKQMRIILSDGRRVWGKALGANNRLDSGMIKIIDEGDYPFVPVGTSAKLSEGQWVVAMGHPGGFVKDRPPVVRLGRIWEANAYYISTDSPLISGDSGGPVFDLDGRLIGINSRIGMSTTSNLHVPIDTFWETWDRLANGDEWGTMEGFFGRVPPAPATFGFGARVLDDAEGAKIVSVKPDTVAAKAGLKEGDLITMVNGGPASLEDLVYALLHREKKKALMLGVTRDGKSIVVRVRFPDAQGDEGGSGRRRGRGGG
jgi:serine protease Do